MDDEADTQPAGQAGGTPTAGAPEHEITIPKWRLDQLARENREIKEELKMSRQMMANLTASRAPQNQPEPEPTAEDLGLDPQLAAAVNRLVQHQVRTIVAPEVKKVRNQAALAFGKGEEAEFLIANAKGDAKRMAQLRAMMPRIKKYQQDAHEQGIPLTLDFAYKFVRLQDQEARGDNPPPRTQNPNPNPGGNQGAPAARSAAPAPAPQVDEFGDIEEPSFPDPAATRMNPAGSGAAGGTAPKSFEEMTPEEMEAALQEQGFSKGVTA